MGSPRMIVGAIKMCDLLCDFDELKDGALHKLTHLVIHQAATIDGATFKLNIDPDYILKCKSANKSLKVLLALTTDEFQNFLFECSGYFNMKKVEDLAKFLKESNFDGLVVDLEFEFNKKMLLSEASEVIEKLKENFTYCELILGASVSVNFKAAHAIGKDMKIDFLILKPCAGFGKTEQEVHLLPLEGINYGLDRSIQFWHVTSGVKEIIIGFPLNATLFESNDSGPTSPWDQSNMENSILWSGGAKTEPGTCTHCGHDLLKYPDEKGLKSRAKFAGFHRNVDGICIDFSEKDFSLEKATVLVDEFTRARGNRVYGDTPHSNGKYKPTNRAKSSIGPKIEPFVQDGQIRTDTQSEQDELAKPLPDPENASSVCDNLDA